jgi:hypothetical protein
MRLLELFRIDCASLSVPQYWAHCRWVNPTDPIDYRSAAEKLARMQQMHIQLRQCSLERVLDVISHLRRPRQPAKDSESDSDSDSPEPPSRADNERQLPSLAGLGLQQSIPIVQSVQLPPLSIGNMDAVSSTSHKPERRCHFSCSPWLRAPPDRCTAPRRSSPPHTPWPGRHHCAARRRCRLRSWPRMGRRDLRLRRGQFPRHHCLWRRRRRRQPGSSRRRTGVGQSWRRFCVGWTRRGRCASCPGLGH